MEAVAGRLHLHPRLAHRHERAHRERQGRRQPGLGQGQGYSPSIRRRHALCGKHRSAQARVQEPSNPRHRHRVDARHQPGGQGGHELRTNYARLPARSLAGRSRELLSRRRTIVDIQSLYQSRLTTPEAAVATISSGTNLAIGMAMAEPPALLAALAARAKAGQVEALKAYYYESTSV